MTDGHETSRSTYSLREFSDRDKHIWLHPMAFDKSGEGKRTLASVLFALLIQLPLCAQSDFPAWVRETPQAQWQARDSQGEVVFRDKLWILGGWFNSYEAPPRDVWSSEDGKQWIRVTDDAPWIHSDLPMSFVFKDRMWMMGGWYNGRLKGHSASNQIWSSSD